MDFLSAITDKKLGKPLNTQQIEYFAKAAAEGLAPDYQLAAMLMAIRLNGMNARESLIIICFKTSTVRGSI